VVLPLPDPGLVVSAANARLKVPRSRAMPMATPRILDIMLEVFPLISGKSYLSELFFGQQEQRA
jgi:hypothetical protein